MTPRNLTSISIFLLCVVAVIYAVIQTQLPHHTFWSNDGGEKLVQVRALIENGIAQPELPYDPLGLEPAGSFEFAPFYPGHARIVDGRLMPVVPFYFPLLSSVPFRLWGHAGLYVIPILATLLTLYCLIILARNRLDPMVMPLSVIGGGLATPIFFYSMLFFEHTLAVCLSTAGLALIHAGLAGKGSQKIILGITGGLVTGLAIWIRGDVYFFLFGLLAAMLCMRRYRSLTVPFIVGCVLALIPFYLVNLQVYGAFSGPQVASMMKGSNNAGFSLLPFLEKRWDILQYLLLTFIDLPSANWIFLFAAVCPPLLIALKGEKLPGRSVIILAWCAILALISVSTFGRLFFLENPMPSTLGILGLFASVPFLPFALIKHRAPEDETGGNDFPRFLSILIAVSLIGYLLGLPSRGGLQWGPRYLLALYPPLILLSLHSAVRIRKSLANEVAQKFFSLLFALILLSGIGIQLFGIGLLHDKKKATALNITEIRKMNPGVLVTDTWWVPEDNGDLYNEIPMYSVYNFTKMDALFRQLAKKGQREVLLVSAADYRTFIAKQPDLQLNAFAMTDHRRMRLFNLYLHRVQLGR